MLDETIGVLRMLRMTYPGFQNTGIGRSRLERAYQECTMYLEQDLADTIRAAVEAERAKYTKLIEAADEVLNCLCPENGIEVRVMEKLCAARKELP